MQLSLSPEPISRHRRLLDQSRKKSPVPVLIISFLRLSLKGRSIVGSRFLHRFPRRPRRSSSDLRFLCAAQVGVRFLRSSSPDVHAKEGEQLCADLRSDLAGSFDPSQIRSCLYTRIYSCRSVRSFFGRQRIFRCCRRIE